MWLLREGQVLSSLEIADTFSTRLRGLMGRSSLQGALFIEPAKSVHTLFMRFPIDIAFVDRDLKVVDMKTMPKWRVGLPRFRARGVLEAEAGAFARWGLSIGDSLELSK